MNGKDFLFETERERIAKAQIVLRSGVAGRDIQPLHNLLAKEIDNLSEGNRVAISPHGCFKRDNVTLSEKFE